MRITLLGMPGSGKGTQGARLAELLGVPLIGIGNLVRARAAVDDETGRELRTTMENGELVSDAFVAQALAERLAAERSRGFVLDGYPRKATQDATLDAMLAELDVKLDAPILLAIDEVTARRRLASRLACSDCGRPTAGGGAEAACGVGGCVGTLRPRVDDRDRVTVARRMEEFRTQTVPVIESYRGASRLIEIDARQDEDAVWADLRAAVAALRGR